jgi:hypothetical protein
MRYRNGSDRRIFDPIHDPIEYELRSRVPNPNAPIAISEVVEALIVVRDKGGDGNTGAIADAVDAARRQICEGLITALLQVVRR